MRYKWKISSKKIAMFIALANLASVSFAESLENKEIEKQTDITLMKTEVECNSGTDTVTFLADYINYTWSAMLPPNPDQGKRDHLLSFYLVTELKERTSYTVLLGWVANDKSDIVCKITHIKKGKPDIVEQTLLFSNLEVQSIAEAIDNNKNTSIKTDIAFSSQKGKMMVNGITIK